MKIAKKSILSSLKAMKGRLFGTQPKPQSESEKNLQNIAKGKRSQSLKPQQEINADDDIPTDKKVLEIIGECEFQFGKEIHKVSEAKLEFIYETGLDSFKIYVIALSENYGAIVFYIPEDKAEIIRRKALTMPDMNFHSYLCYLVESAAQFRHIAEQNGVHSYDADIAGAELVEISRNLALAGVITAREAVESMIALATAPAHEANKPIDTRISPNNWLKLHGYPMRRKENKRK